MTAWDEATGVEALGEGRYGCTVDPRLWVVAGPNGGYVAALLVRALREEVGPDRALRALTVHFPRAPREGEAEIAVAIERQGRGLTTASARLEQGGTLCAVALAALAADYPMAATWDGPAIPDVAPPEDEDPAALGEAGFRPPPFAEHFAFRLRFGPLPFTGGDEARIGGWIRLREERPLDEALLVNLTDAWFPAPFGLLTGPAAAPTIDLTVHLRAPLPREDPWVLVDMPAGVGRDGFFDEDTRVWARDGTLLAISRQLALLLPLDRGAASG